MSPTNRTVLRLPLMLLLTQLITPAFAGNTVTLSTQSIAFNNVPIGTRAAAQAITLTNGTSATISVEGISLGNNYGQFVLGANSCGSTLAAGTSCTIQVMFSPTLGGRFSGSVTVLSSPAAVPSSVALTGNSVGQYTFTGLVQADGAAVNAAYVSVYEATLNASAPTLLAIATTNNKGIYSATYDCPSTATSAQYVYVQASGGTPVGASAPNNAIRFLSGVGACGSPPSVSMMTNELTTVAFAYAFNGFTSLPSSNSAWVNVTSNQPLNGLKVASDTYGTLVQPSGQVPASLVSSQIDASQILNTLANALAVCVSPSATGSSCRTFADATAINQPAPSDTLSAARSVVRNPSRVSVQSLVTDGEGAGAPYAPTLAAGSCMGALNDWTLVELFGFDENSPCGYQATGGLLAPMGLAIDASGNVWVVNNAAGGFSVDSGVAGISVFNDVGTPLNNYGIETSNGSNALLWAPVAIAIGPDNSGGYFGWITSQPASDSLSGGQGAGRITRFELGATLANCPATSSGCTLVDPSVILGNGTGFAQPQGIAIDGANNAWFASLYQLGSPYVSPGTPSGVLTQIAASGAAGTPGSDPNDASAAHQGPQYHDVGVDARGNVWVLDGANGLLLEYDPATAAWTNGSGFATGFDRGFGVNPGYATSVGNHLAIDPSGNVWVAQTSNSGGTLPAFNSKGLLANLPSEPDLHDPSAIAIDGAGNVFAVNKQNNDTANGFACMVEISNFEDVSYNPTSADMCGLGNYTFSSTYSIALDQAGNLWGSSSDLGYLVKIIGVAAPTVTPLSAAPR
jgi:hypothetical protein